VRLPLAELGLPTGPGEAFQVHELISDARYLWQGESNFVLLDPAASPAQVFRIRRKVKTEKDFDYYF
jgi:starch synthase (maltosyl-transferring)